MSLRDTLGLNKGRKPLPKPATPPATQAAAQQPATPVAAKPVKETVKFKCGHAVPCSQFADKLCPKCRQQADEAHAAKVQEVRKQRNATRLQQGRDQYHRLPTGSTFTVTYDAEAASWAGTLTVPGVGTFSDSAPGVFRLESRLDKQYRAKLLDLKSKKEGGA